MAPALNFASEALGLGLVSAVADRPDSSVRFSTSAFPIWTARVSMVDVTLVDGCVQMG